MNPAPFRSPASERSIVTSSPSSRSKRRERNGFTLIEVLVAFMILAVGLLALEAMGIGAARMVRRAERVSEYNTEAMSALESTLSEIRQNQNPTTATRSLSRAILQVQPTSSNGNRFWTVRVSVRPYGDDVLAVSDSFSITGYVLR